MNNVKHWSKSIVIFHILLVVSILVLFLSGDNKDLMAIHENIGYFVFLLVLFRFYYSFSSKNKHEKISSWFYSIPEILHFLKNFFTHKETQFHNPAASLVMIALVSLIIVNVFTGSLGFSGVEDEGYLSYFIDVDYELGETLLDIHEVSTTILLFFIVAHIVGSIVGSILSKTNLIKSIFTFNKDKHDKK